MGSENSKLSLQHLGDLQQRAGDIERNLLDLNGSLTTLSTSFIPKGDMDSKLSVVEGRRLSLNDQVEELLKVAEEQQRQVDESKERYSKLCEDQSNCQKALKDVTEGFESRFNKYDQELDRIRSRFAEIDVHLAKGAEISKVIGINRSENMISKMKMNEKRNAKKSGKKTDEPAENSEAKQSRDKISYLFSGQGAPHDKKLISRTNTSLLTNTSTKESEGNRVQSEAQSTRISFQSPL